MCLDEIFLKKKKSPKNKKLKALQKKHFFLKVHPNEPLVFLEELRRLNGIGFVMGLEEQKGE